jgi:glycerol-3-phosphate dehydrogenase (NAD(P)+)
MGFRAVNRMKVGYLGAGTWGSALAALLAEKGNEVVVWGRDKALISLLDKERKHPKLEGFIIPSSIRFTEDISEALDGIDLLVESVTSSGVRPVFTKIASLGSLSCPIVLTSKGIEQGTDLLLPQVVVQVLGSHCQKQVGCLSGPSHAEEVVKHLPTSIVSSSFDAALVQWIGETFSTSFFRIYPNPDILGVCFGGAMKNCIAIACGISDGLEFGDNTKAALMTRGLHEMRKLAMAFGCNPETLNGLSGLGDLFVTCASTLSRNYRFGRLISKGYSMEKAKEEIGMAVEGAYTCVSAVELASKMKVPVPITEAVHSILYEGMSPMDAVKSLLQRAIKEERL